VTIHGQARFFHARAFVPRPSVIFRLRIVLISPVYIVHGDTSARI
jgi:hypothetical protein